MNNKDKSRGKDKIKITPHFLFLGYRIYIGRERGGEIEIAREEEQGQTDGMEQFVYPLFSGVRGGGYGTRLPSSRPSFARAGHGGSAALSSNNFEACEQRRFSFEWKSSKDVDDDVCGVYEDGTHD